MGSGFSGMGVEEVRAFTESQANLEWVAEQDYVHCLCPRDTLQQLGLSFTPLNGVLEASGTESGQKASRRSCSQDSLYEAGRPEQWKACTVVIQWCPPSSCVNNQQVSYVLG